MPPGPRRRRLVEGGPGGLRVIHTPGHSPGHIALLHGPGRTLLMGDAVFHRGGLDLGRAALAAPCAPCARAASRTCPRTSVRSASPTATRSPGPAPRRSGGSSRPCDPRCRSARRPWHRGRRAEVTV
ncbi:MBL fold metallo-hydrolase [Streptomyces brasiliensis]|uniref:MBL fold metallo-hydrolase n=1 Tax=Streptomyces brasiliensis TaxID=1954 RepID=UPI001670EDA7|nr:MBL fold metallo-hydrolase [Streptomyces brasiliensis]